MALSITPESYAEVSSQPRAELQREAPQVSTMLAAMFMKAQAKVEGAMKSRGKSKNDEDMLGRHKGDFPPTVKRLMSGEVVLMTLLGGLGTVFGPVVGAFIVITLENYLAQLGAWVTVVQGAIFVVCVLTFRRGVVGELARLIRKPL